MKLYAGILLGLSALALSGCGDNNSSAIKETNNYCISSYNNGKLSYEHCQKGDIIKIGSEIASYCSYSNEIIANHSCVYIGEKREMVKR